jgi:hypothetical protein
MRIEGPPPTHSVSSSSLIFPPLAEFTVGGDATHGWLSLLQRLEHGISATHDATPLSKVKESLKILNVEHNLSGPIIDASFASPIQTFRSLVCLNVGTRCHDVTRDGRCTFKLNNDDITELAMALSQLESLLLGRTCPQNTCATTVACLLQISVHCVKLRRLEIHFNTTNIVNDFKNVSEDSRFQELRLLPRCTLSCLDVGLIPHTLDEPGFETVVNGMVNIFPSLERCADITGAWNELSRRIAGFQKR